MKIFSKKSWFTFVEILLSTAISIIILIFTFSFLADSIDNLTRSENKVKILSETYAISEVINSYKNVYLTGGLLFDKTYESWNDILLLKDLSWSWGVIFWVIDMETMKFETWSVYNQYKHKVFWYKELSINQLNLINSNSGVVYNWTFTNDHLFTFPVKSFQLDYYNSGIIWDFNLEVLMNYNAAFSGQLWNQIPSSSYDLFKLNFTF